MNSSLLDMPEFPSKPVMAHWKSWQLRRMPLEREPAVFQWAVDTWGEPQPSAMREHLHLRNRLLHAAKLLKDSVDINPKKRGGVPCLRGTRLTIAQVIAQFAEGDSVEDFVEDMDIDKETLVSFLNGLSIILDRPATSASDPT